MAEEVFTVDRAGAVLGGDSRWTNLPVEVRQAIQAHAANGLACLQFDLTDIKIHTEDYLDVSQDEAVIYAVVELQIRIPRDGSNPPAFVEVVPGGRP